jgi:hypothetical protein
VIFNKNSSIEKRSWDNCKCFAKAVFIAAGIETPDFGAHPEVLLEYLGTDVSSWQQPPKTVPSTESQS